MVHVSTVPCYIVLFVFGNSHGVVYVSSDTNWEDTGSAFGFATEISPGAAPLTLDSMKKTVAKDYPR